MVGTLLEDHYGQAGLGQLGRHYATSSTGADHDDVALEPARHLGAGSDRTSLVTSSVTIGSDTTRPAVAGAADVG